MHRFIRAISPTICAAIVSITQIEARAAEVILYDFFDFGGANVTLTQSAPDLDVHNFDNDVESIRVLSGTWSFHRDDDFGNGNGPSITLGPGNYANIEALGFPADRMSSVRLIADDQPAPVACPSPYLVPGPDGLCVFDCREGTVPNPATSQCDCAQGLTEIGIDAQFRRVCGPYTLAPPQEAHWITLDGVVVNNGGNQVTGPDVRLWPDTSSSQSLNGPNMFRAAEGPLVNDPSAMLRIAQQATWQRLFVEPSRQQQYGPFRLSGGAGQKYVYVQVRALTSNDRWIESNVRMVSIVASPPAPIVIHPVPAGEAFALALASGFEFWPLQHARSNYLCYLQQNGAELELIAEFTGIRVPGFPYPGLCEFRLFGGRNLNSGWSLAERVEVEPNICSDGPVLAFVDTSDPHIQVAFNVDFNYSPNLLSNCLLHGWTLRTIRVHGPQRGDWRDAFR